MTTNSSDAATTEYEALIVAVGQRVEWARQILAGEEYTEAEKVWVRRYEMDVPALVEAIRGS